MTKAVGNLPSQLTSFIGREPTVSAVDVRLQLDRLITLVGPGGCGKTRLALAIGQRTGGRFVHGVYFVDLSGLSDSGLVPGAVLRSLGWRAAPGRDPLEVLVMRLSDRGVLVLLDNCEHLLKACASLAETIVRGCPSVSVLATSRERLGVPGETVVAVEGLELPDRTAHGPVESIETSEAGTLFIDRARRAHRDFSLDDENAAAIGQICAGLDGIPLAIELAAARARLMSPAAIAEGLSDRFRLLVDAGRAGPERHKTLLASIEWSCSLLQADELALLRRLSVFSSGFTLAAAETVGSGDVIRADRVLALLTSLVDKCLVHADPAADRFRLHETMRAYAGDALEREGRTAETRDRHLAYFTGLAKTTEPKLRTSELTSAVAGLEPELDNVRAALDWGVQTRQCDATADLLAPLSFFFFVLGLWGEAGARCQRLLAEDLQPALRADLLFRAAASARNSDPSAGLRLAEELTALGRGLGDDLMVARGLWLTANVQAWAEPEMALKTVDEGMAFSRKASGEANGGPHTTSNDPLNPPGSLVMDVCNKAWAYFWLGFPEQALLLADEALSQAEEADYLWGVINSRTIASITAIYSGASGRAIDEAETLVRLSTELSSPTFVCWGERHRGEAYMYLGARELAATAFARARPLPIQSTTRSIWRAPRRARANFRSPWATTGAGTSS